jgi:hypothetical protein
VGVWDPSKLRRNEGYSAAMLIHESRILLVTVFGTLHQNLSALAVADLSAGLSSDAGLSSLYFQ